MKPLLASVVLILASATSTFADDEGDRFHLDLGLTYSSGVSKIDKALQDGYQANGHTYDSFYIPVGLQFDPYFDLVHLVDAP